MTTIGSPEKETAYLAGPMRGLPEFNFPAFRAAAEELRLLGWNVISPAERDEEADFDPSSGDGPKTIAEYMADDLPLVCRADAIILLPGWRGSQGARVEAMVASLLGKDLLEYPDLVPVKSESNVLTDAMLLVDGEREQTYGHPYDDFGRTAGFWNVRFGHMLAPGMLFAPEDVAAGMRLVKESRLVSSPRHRDSLIDIAGYARTQEKVWGRDV